MWLESATQPARPAGRAIVRVALVDGTEVEGELLWADAAFLKIAPGSSGEPRLVPKMQVRIPSAGPGPSRSTPSASARALMLLGFDLLSGPRALIDGVLGRVF